MQTAAGYYRLEYVALNRKNYDKANGSILRAKGFYFTAPFKGGEFITVNMPQRRDELLAAMEALDNSIIRHNGSLGGTFQLSHDVKMSYKHRKEATMLFLQRMTDFRTRAVAGFHDQDTHNPHAHVWIYDKDTETGQPVAYLNTNRRTREDLGLEPNAVEHIRKVWEEVTNKVLEKYDYDFRVDRRSNLERGLEAAGKHRGWQAEQELEAGNDNAELPQEPVADVPVSEELPTDTPLEIIDEPTPPDVLNGPLAAEEELAEIPHVDADITPTIVLEGATLGDNARLGAGAAFELRRIRTLQRERQQVRDKYHAAHAAWQQAIAVERQADKDALAAAQHRDITRQTFIEEHHNILGRKKGFQVSLFGYSYTSPARRAADAAEQQYQYATREAQHAAEAVEHARAYMERMEAEKAIAEDEYDAVQGNEAELQEAAAIMEATVNEYVGELSRENILAMGEDGTLSPEQTKVLLEELGYDRDIDNSLEP